MKKNNCFIWLAAAGLLGAALLLGGCDEPRTPLDDPTYCPADPMLPECPEGAHHATDGPVGIVMWHPYTAETEQAMEDVAAAFNAAQSDIVVSVEAQGSYGELLA